MCILTYWSLFAGLVFILPLLVSNYLTFAFMGFMDIGLNVNTLPISALGIGLGVDYGLYHVSRIREEYHICKNHEQAFITALHTTGGAVFFTATTLIAGVIFWYILSPLRFQAEMGLLLALWMFSSAVGGIVLIPTFLAVTKPKFITRGRLPWE
jgi:predicted RND superfamily exporter protein